MITRFKERKKFEPRKDFLRLLTLVLKEEREAVLFFLDNGPGIP
jgi:hypothetical protein